ncbi:MAG: aldehyde dehydrogenase family protein, partial [Clostridia bacterium]|nr:aldehyde dehydrogenase family protein [Clostridia bacterium]
ETDRQRRFIAPTMLELNSPYSPIMQEEIFGPILPVLTYTELDTCLDFIRKRPKPLALYLFTANPATEDRVLNTCSFGGGCINDTIIHLATCHMPFGGVGASGLGSYHGKQSFDTFTHYRSIVKKSTWLDLPMRYFPYTESKLRMIRKFMK